MQKILKNLIQLFFPQLGNYEISMNYSLLREWDGVLGTEANLDKKVPTGDMGLITQLGIVPGEGNDNPLQDSCLETPMDGGA